MSPRTVLLLDFDGVVLRSPATSRLISSRCIKYVSMKTGVTDEVKARRLNEHLYTRYGHTVLGLQGVGFQNCSLEDFNAFVYDNIDYRHLIRHIDNDSNFFGKDIDRLCASGFYDVFIFSNARQDWVYGICSALNYPIHKRCRGVLDVSDYFLKPQPSAYQLAHDMIEPSVKAGSNVVFVDDSMLNILPLRSSMIWHPILFDPNSTSKHQYTGVHCISELSELIVPKKLN